MKRIPFEKVGGRKWITGIGCMITEVVLLFCGLITELVFKELFILTFLVSVGSNVVQKIWAKTSENDNKEEKKDKEDYD
jgi:Na+-transporting methylmalonyl-CoA/oxaloacetate decarboxylase gamma subunit